MSQKKLTRSYIHIPLKKPISGETFGQRFNKTADKNPDKEMYVFYADKERKTFRQMQEEVSISFQALDIELGTC